MTNETDVIQMRDNFAAKTIQLVENFPTDREVMQTNDLYQDTIHSRDEVAQVSAVPGVITHPYLDMRQWAGDDPVIAKMPGNRIAWTEFLTKLGIVVALAREGQKLPKSKFTNPINQITWHPGEQRLAYIGRPDELVEIGPFDNFMMLGGVNDVLVFDFDWNGRGPTPPPEVFTDRNALFQFMHTNPGFKALWDEMVSSDGHEAASRWFAGQMIVISPKNGFHTIGKAPQDCGLTANTDAINTKADGDGAIDPRYTNAYAIGPGSATLQELKPDGTLRSAQGTYRLAKVPDGFLEYIPPRSLGWLQTKMAEKTAKAHVGTLTGAARATPLAQLATVTALPATPPYAMNCGTGFMAKPTDANGDKIMNRQDPLELLAKHIFYMETINKEVKKGGAYPFASRDKWRDEIMHPWAHLEAKGLGVLPGEGLACFDTVCKADDRYDAGVAAQADDHGQYNKAVQYAQGRRNDKCDTYETIHSLANGKGWSMRAVLTAPPHCSAASMGLCRCCLLCGWRKEPTRDRRSTMIRRKT